MEKMEQENKSIKTKETTSIPFFVHEGILARFERINKRLWITVILLIILLVGTNAGWIWYESQFIEQTIEVTQENADGYNNYIGNDGDINNGETNDQNSNESQEG